MSIQKILNLNHDVQPSGDAHMEGGASTGLVSQSTPILNEDGDPIWKVLVFDNKGRDVISSVLRVNDLRAWGVTIHLYESSHSSPGCLTNAYPTWNDIGTSIQRDIPYPTYQWSISLNQRRTTFG